MDNTFQILSLEVALASQEFTTVLREDATYAEMLVLRHMHGRESIRRMKLVGREERDPVGERDRLERAYGQDIVTQLFPGVESSLPRGDARLAEKMLAEARTLADEAQRQAELAKGMQDDEAGEAAEAAELAAEDAPARRGPGRPPKNAE